MDHEGRLFFCSCLKNHLARVESTESKQGSELAGGSSPQRSLERAMEHFENGRGLG
jgi:hypothetical protein